MYMVAMKNLVRQFYECLHMYIDQLAMYHGHHMHLAYYQMRNNSIRRLNDLMY